eukprot:352836-Chlamydomonas_euryale.AAC.2
MGRLWNPRPLPGARMQCVVYPADRVGKYGDGRGGSIAELAPRKVPMRVCGGTAVSSRERRTKGTQSCMSAWLAKAQPRRCPCRLPETPSSTNACAWGQQRIPRRAARAEARAPRLLVGSLALEAGDASLLSWRHALHTRCHATCMTQAPTFTRSKLSCHALRSGQHHQNNAPVLPPTP